MRTSFLLPLLPFITSLTSASPFSISNAQDVQIIKAGSRFDPHSLQILRRSLNETIFDDESGVSEAYDYSDADDDADASNNGTLTKRDYVVPLAKAALIFCTEPGFDDFIDYGTGSVKDGFKGQCAVINWPGKVCDHPPDYRGLPDKGGLLWANSARWVHTVNCRCNLYWDDDCQGRRMTVKERSRYIIHENQSGSLVGTEWDRVVLTFRCFYKDKKPKI